MFGSVLPSDQFARFLAERLAKVGCPIAVFKIFPRHGAKLLRSSAMRCAARRTEVNSGRTRHDRKNSACRRAGQGAPGNAIAVWPNAHPLIADTRTAFHTS